MSHPPQDTFRLLVIDDDTAFSEVLVAGLTAEGHQVRSVATVADGLHALHQETDLLLLDLEVAADDGMDVLRRLRSDENPLPVIIMTGSRLDTDDTVIGLEEGADDYLRKPFVLKELLARIHAVLRRHHPDADTTCAAGDLKIDRLKRTVTCRDEPVQVTLRELELLALLVRNLDTEVTRSDVLEQVWSDSPRSASLDNTLDVHISRLRKKLQEADSQCGIHTVWGKGFKLTVESA
jgi:DNA-binding response OmpR family regulator